MSDTPTWREARRDAREAAAEAWVYNVAEGSHDDANDLAHEYADGCEDVIYTHRARSIWMDSSDVQTYEGEADDLMGGDESADIDKRITICVYAAIRAAYFEAYEELEALEVPECALVWSDNAAVAYGDADEMEERRREMKTPTAYHVITLENYAYALRDWAMQAADEELGLREARKGATR